MQEHRYLLNIKELEDADERGELWQRVIHMLDADRLRKFQKIGHKNGRAACAGAGLLLQQAYCRYEEEKTENGMNMQPIRLESVRVDEILYHVKERALFEIVYREKGKPEIKGNPFCYNISHSGEYVFCGVSDYEIGVDIQEQKTTRRDNEAIKELRLAERFFSEEEFREMEKMKDEADVKKQFYRLWTRKEAVGKLHGTGLMEWIGWDMRHDPENKGNGYIWEEYEVSNCLIAVCRFERT